MVGLFPTRRPTPEFVKAATFVSKSVSCCASHHAMTLISRKQVSNTHRSPLFRRWPGTSSPIGDCRSLLGSLGLEGSPLQGASYPPYEIVCSRTWTCVAHRRRPGPGVGPAVSWRAGHLLTFRAASTDASLFWFNTATGGCTEAKLGAVHTNLPKFFGGFGGSFGSEQILLKTLSAAFHALRLIL